MANKKGTKGEVSPELKSDEEREGGQEFMRYSIHEMEQRVVGRHAGKVEAIRTWVIRGRVIPKADLADVLQIPVSVFDGVLDLIEGRPD